MKALFDLDVALEPIARQIGSDVPFFLTGGRARAEGRGEQLTKQSVPGNRWFAIAWPGIELKTADVYRAWDEVKGERPNELRRAAEHVDHHHESGAVRGVLCFQCNAALGMFEDDVSALRRAGDYLKGEVWRPSLMAPGVYQLLS